MANLVLPAKEAMVVVSEGSDSYELIHSDMVGEWRWGVIYEAVIKDSEGNLWGTTYQVQTGDNYYHEFEDLDQVEFYPVKAITKTIVTYEKA